MVYLLYMQKVSIKDLKKRLSSVFEMAFKGTPVEITRYNEPFVYIYGAATPGLHIGKRVLKDSLQTVLDRPFKGSSLKVLLQDRKADVED